MEPPTRGISVLSCFPQRELHQTVSQGVRCKKRPTMPSGAILSPAVLAQGSDSCRPKRSLKWAVDARRQGFSYWKQLFPQGLSQTHRKTVVPDRHAKRKNVKRGEGASALQIAVGRNHLGKP